MEVVAVYDANTNKLLGTSKDYKSKKGSNQMKVIVMYNGDGDTIGIAKDYETAINFLYQYDFIDSEDDIYIEGHWTTLKDFFGEEDCGAMMRDNWDIDMFNEFWNGDYALSEWTVIE